MEKTFRKRVGNKVYTFKIITDGRKLLMLSKKYGFTYDSKHKYLTDTNTLLSKYGYSGFTHNNQKYTFMYFSGSIYPYLVQQVSVKYSEL